MRTTNVNRYSLFSCFAAALLAGCGGSQPPIGAPGAMPQTSRIATQGNHGKSWMKPGMSGQDLLYVSSNAGTVSVFTYPQGKLVGGFSPNGFPAGECVDPAGDVFITSSTLGGGSATSTIYEYAHGGTTPIATLSDPGFANGCAVDPTTGNLAVANIGDDSGSNPYYPNGDVAVYAGAQGLPKMYYSADLPGFDFCGYDNSGNLYLSSWARDTGNGLLVRLLQGNSPFAVISFNAQIQFGTPPSVQWDGQHMTISSLLNRKTASAYVYRLNISGSTATVVGRSKLSYQSEHHQGQIWIEGNAIIAIDGERYKNTSFWNYPKGGRPTHTIKNVAPGLWGVAVSLAQAHSRIHR